MSVLPLAGDRTDVVQPLTRGTYATDKNNFAPRFGIVWTKTSTPSTTDSVRS